MLQTGEIIIIALLALVVLGPTRLPEMARKIGKWTAELRQAARDITAGLEAEVADLKDAGQQLKAPLDEVKKPFREIGEEMGSLGKGLEWKGPKPLSGPTPEDAMRDLEEMNRLSAESTEPPDSSQEDPPSGEPTGD